MTEFAMTPVGDITEGPNVRSKLGDLDELAASLSSQGMLEPVTVRRKGTRLELVFGFRRLRAAKLAKLAEVPTLVRELTDDEVLEVQLCENRNRLDMDPIDEALGYRQLIAHGRTTSEIADKMGCPPSYIAKRLKLCSLSDKAIDALHNEKISLGVALLIARLPTTELQDKALEEVSPDYNSTPMSVAEAKDTIEREVMRDLTLAPFDRVSLDLVATAGSCNACPKRTGAQAELFGDGTSPDLCTDPGCFRGKLDAHWALVQREAKAKGLEVLPKAKAEAAIRYHEGGDSGFRKLDDTVYIGSKKRTVRQLLGGKDVEPVAIARDEQSGVVVELVPKRDVDAAVKAARKAAGEKDDPGPSDYQKAEADKRKTERARRLKLTELLVATIEAKFKKPPGGVPPAFLQALVLGAIESTWNETHKAIITRRKLETAQQKADRTTNDEILRAAVETTTSFGALLGLLAELLTGRGQAFEADARVDDDDIEHPGSGYLALEALRVDVEAIDLADSDAKPEKAAKAKSKGGTKVHLIGITGGPACGSKAAAKGGSSTLNGVDCENCIRVGPAILEQKATARANQKRVPKPKKKTVKKKRATNGN